LPAKPLFAQVVEEQQQQQQNNATFFEPYSSQEESSVISKTVTCKWWPTYRRQLFSCGTPSHFPRSAAFA
jgi:hypothetical protein